MKDTIAGVDLSKEVIQVCVSKRNKVHSNIEMTPNDFLIFLQTSKPMTIVFEACGMSNYWRQEAEKAGHDARLISAKLVSNIRQNQKTDKNDALAIIQASQLSEIKFINGKTVAQQELQSMIRLRELAVRNRDASRNQLEALLLEFNIRITVRKGGLGGVIESVLEDASNGFGDSFREMLYLGYQDYLATAHRIQRYDRLLEQEMKKHPDCEKLLALEGIGVINAVNLYIALGCSESNVFKKGRDASACIGVSPIQHSTGGKVKIGSIGRHVKNKSLRSYLICGAMSVVHQVAKREPRTEKELWLKRLIERRGKKCAAVALANKNVRTAFAMLTQGTEYQAQPLAA